MKELRYFYLDQHIRFERQRKADESGSSDKGRFWDVVDMVKAELDKDWRASSEQAQQQKSEREKNAIIGIEKDVMFYKDLIKNILMKLNLTAEHYPAYYPSLEEAMFSEIYGLSALAPWAYDWLDKYKESSSAKIIGDNLYCLIDGKSVLQEQKIPAKRREQLKRSLLLATPKERLEEGFHEVYLANGIRVTIFSGDRTKKGKDVMVFRKYVLDTPSLEDLAKYHTFPYEAIPLFRSMIKIGYNTVILGQVRSGKTTFLKAWQKEEDKTLEGVCIATDPETNWSKICGKAPIMELIADGDKLTEISKSLKRSDCDYYILEEMRDAVAYNLFIEITSMGTMRSKCTIHAKNPVNVPSKMASAIKTVFGGDQDAIVSQIYENINYLIELYQVPENKSRKRVKTITELRYDPAENRVSAHTICEYDVRTDSWKWYDTIGADKEDIAKGYDEEFSAMRKALKDLAAANPLDSDKTIYPNYYKGNVEFMKGE